MHLSRPLSALLSFFLALVAAIPAARAQARITADKTAELDLFGGIAALDHDYYSRDIHPSYLLGGDYTHFIKRFHGLLIPSFQIRGTLSPGPTDSQRTIEGGLKLATTYHRLHPYGYLMVGQGVITFPLPAVLLPGVRYYIRDTSFLYIAGAGVTYDVKRDWSAMLDYEHQYWDLGRTGSPVPVRFYPQSLTFGVVYRIPFKAFKHR